MDLKKKDFSDWAGSIDKQLTPDRSTARFVAIPEVNRHIHFSSQDIAVLETVHQVLEIKKVPSGLVYKTIVNIQVAETKQN